MVQNGLWCDFLQTYCDCELEGLLLEPPGAPHYILPIDGLLLLDYNLQLCSGILSDPKIQLDALSRSAVESEQQLLTHFRNDSHLDVEAMTIKNTVHVRLHNLPDIPELVRNRVPTCADMGKFLIVNGTVTRTGSTKVLERIQRWKCQSCQNITEKEGLFELRYKLTSPKTCSVDTCKGYKFQHLQGEHMRCSDYQEIKIQEKVERLDMGTIPRSMTVVLEYDLVDSCKAGDDVTIYGIVTQMWDQPVVDTRCSLETVLNANSIEIHNEQRCNLDVTDNAISRHYGHWRRYRDNPMAGRNLILASFCPEVYQLYIVKLAALLVILGGVTHMDGRGSKVRGECHMLMVGDPGTGKSQILKYVSKLSPRSVITTGIGCTKAGLTVAAVKEVGEWSLEAGAMVLADGGVCCVDELSSIRETDRVAIHEAMEQQTISVAKAGLVCKLNTRTTVLAATNPRGAYDITQPISANVPIGTPLLSRFDLILVLFDDHTSVWDNLVAGYLLKEESVIEESDILKNYTADTLWTFEELQQYVGHVKSLTPKLTGPAKEVLGRYYRRQREHISRNVSRTTIRMLESLVRLSQGHAKLMLHDSVLLEDAIVTISLVECTMLNSSLLGSVSVLHSVFPSDPQLEFNKQKTMVLEVLGLPPDFGESQAVRLPPQPRPYKKNNMVDISSDMKEVPSLHVNSQELRKELQEKDAHVQEDCKIVDSKADPSITPSVLEDDIHQSSLQQNRCKSAHHRACNEQRSKQPRKPLESSVVLLKSLRNYENNVTATSSASPSPRKASFAELVRNFKARKRAKTVPQMPPPDKTQIEEMFNQDFSDILSPETSPAPIQPHNVFEHNPHTSDVSPGCRSKSPQTVTPLTLTPHNNQTENVYDMEERWNTPVTNMFRKFKSSPEQQASTAAVAADLLTVLKSGIEKESSVEAGDVREAVRVSVEGAPLAFTPCVNTQSVGLTSSHLGFCPPPPHFNLSPVPLTSKHTSTSQSDCHPVCTQELAAKTARPSDQQTSIFHNAAAEKLKKFSYQARK